MVECPLPSVVTDEHTPYSMNAKSINDLFAGQIFRYVVESAYSRLEKSSGKSNHISTSVSIFPIELKLQLMSTLFIL